MIRVNLLREISPTRGKIARTELKPLAVLLGGLILIGALGIAWNWSLLGSKSNLSARQQELQAEKLRLNAIQAELEKHRQQKAQLDKRTAVVKNLLANRHGPVNLMNALIKSIPDEPVLWLTGLSQNGNRVVIQGNAFDVPSIARFISSLGNQKVFRDVDLDFWEETETSLRFQITCLVENY